MCNVGLFWRGKCVVEACVLTGPRENMKEWNIPKVAPISRKILKRKEFQAQSVKHTVKSLPFAVLMDFVASKDDICCFCYRNRLR